MIDSTGYRVAVEQRLAIASIEYAIERFSQERHSSSIDARLEAGEALFTAAKDAWALLHAMQPDVPLIGPIGIA